MIIVRIPVLKDENRTSYDSPPPRGINALQEALGVKEQVQRLVGALEHEYINVGKGDSRPLAVSPCTGPSRLQARKPPKPSPPARGVVVREVLGLLVRGNAAG